MNPSSSLELLRVITYFAAISWDPSTIILALRGSKIMISSSSLELFVRSINGDINGDLSCFQVIGIFCVSFKNKEMKELLHIRNLLCFVIQQYL